MADINVESVLLQLTLQEKASLTAGLSVCYLLDNGSLTPLQALISGIRLLSRDWEYRRCVRLMGPMASAGLASSMAYLRLAYHAPLRWALHSTNSSFILLAACWVEKQRPRACTYC